METQKRLAELASRLLGMHVWFPILLTVFLLKTGLALRQIAILGPSLFIVGILIPVGYIFFAQKLGHVSGWDLPRREERHTFFLVALASSFVSMLLVYIFGNTLFFSLSVILLLQTIMLAVITRFWKISLHVSLTTSCTIVINFFFHWQLPFLYLAIPLVMWARYTLTRHTIAQMLAGFIFSTFSLLFAFRLLGYI